jgi:uncharacterized membrane protein
MLLLSQVLGRFHPLIVHLPIGFLLLAFIFECASLVPRFKKLKQAVSATVMLGALAATIACITGYLLKQEGGYDDGIADLHEVLGIATAAFSFFLFFLRKEVKKRVAGSQKRKQFRVALFVPLILLLSLTGHFGGSLTHGEDYLSFTPEEEVETMDPMTKIKTIALHDSAVLYRDVIQPLLEARCYSCHSAKKQKGQLRLDGTAFIERGGKNGKVLVAGLPDSSELYIRIMLPLEDEDHMPPSEKPQLSSTEVALLQTWIEEGAGFDTRISTLKDPKRIYGYLNAYQVKADHNADVPEGEIKAPDKAALDELRALGVIVIPAEETSNYLMVNFVNMRSVSEKAVKAIVKLKDHIVWMNLGHTGITDQQLNTLADLSNLRVLYLDHTPVTDSGVKTITHLKELRYLNLVGTAVTDAALTFLSGMEGLQKLFVFQTRITSEGVRNFQKASSTVFVDTGNYELEKLATDTINYTRKL